MKTLQKKRLAASLSAQRLLFRRLNVSALLTQVTQLRMRGLGRRGQEQLGQPKFDGVIALKLEQVLPRAFLLLESLGIEYLDISVNESGRKNPDSR